MVLFYNKKTGQIFSKHFDFEGAISDWKILKGLEYTVCIDGATYELDWIGRNAIEEKFNQRYVISIGSCLK